jgi:hypothetical protein
MKNAAEVYAETINEKRDFDSEKFRLQFAKASELHPIHFGMPVQNKRVQAAQRLKILSDSSLLCPEITRSILEYMYNMRDEEIEMIV